MGGAGQLLNDELPGPLDGQSEDLRDLLNGDLAGGILEMGWIGPVTPPGDLDLVFGVVPSLVEVRGMPFLPRNAAKTALVTDQLKPIAGGAHSTEGVRLPSVAACSLHSTGSGLPEYLRSDPRSPK